MDHDLLAYRCTSCEAEFAVVMLNKTQIVKNDDDPACPECCDAGDVTRIDCIILKLADRGVEFRLDKSVKPLEK